VTDATGNKGSWSTRFTSELGYTELVERATEAIKSKDMAEIKKLASNPKTADILSRECVNWDQETMQCRMMLSGFALVAAIAANDTSAVNALLAAGVHPDSRFASSNWNKGYSPMTYAIAGGRPEIARILVDAGANINHINPNGSNAFITALAIGRIDLARWLMQRGADVNVPYREDGKIYSALHIAATSENTQLFRELLQNGAQITTDDAGHTPGYYIYWLTKDVELAVAAGYPEAREYEAKANDPGFDWAEFARRMEPALQQFGQNVAAAQQQYNQRVADINDTYNSQLGQMYSSLNQLQSPYTTEQPTTSFNMQTTGISTITPDQNDTERSGGNTQLKKDSQENSCSDVYIVNSKDYKRGGGVVGGITLGYLSSSCVFGSQSQTISVCGIMIYHTPWQNGYNKYDNFMSNRKIENIVVYQYTQSYSDKKELARCRL
jgi:hypothetical protein